ncbi:hypothetical protein GF362_03800 [Candidatus Dojkabacteria bacterium]|nr:hypothetical protein [Candidatus Dojkabacteria bacterium]
MFNWITYAFASVSSLATKDILQKKIAKKNGVYSILSVQNFFSLIISLIIALFLGISLTLDREGLIFCLIALLQSIGSIGKANAIDVNMSATSIVNSFSPIFPIILAFIFLNEFVYFNPRSLEGLIRIFTLILLPIVILLLKSNKLGRKGKTNAFWIINILLQLVFHGLTTFLNKYYLDFNNIWKNIVYTRIVTFIVSSLFMLMKKEKWERTPKFLGKGFLNGSLIIFSASTHRTAVVLSPLSIYQTFRKPLLIIFSTLAGMQIFKEGKKLNKKQIAGFILGLISLLFIIFTSLQLK